MGNRVEAVKFYNSAVKALNEKTNPDGSKLAYQLFSTACLTDPTWWEAHYHAGCNNHDLKCYEAAVANTRLSLQCKATPPERAKSLTNLGWCLHNLGRTQEAFAATTEALSITPNEHLPYINLSLIYTQMADAPKVLETATRAFELNPHDITAQVCFAFANLFNAKWAIGLKHFESRFEWRLKNFLQFPYKKWEGEEDKTVFLVADQGLGDTLSYSRFVERAAARCRYMHLYIQPSLSRLFAHSFNHLKNINIIPQPQPFPEADYWSTFVSLPYALKLTDAEIEQQPHISYPNIRHPMRGMWKVPDRKFHVGIAWRGSPQNDIDKFRNIPVQNFYEFTRIPGVQLYSLQVGEFNKDMHDTGGAAVIRDLVPGVGDIVDTLGILADLDLVICCESALGHIAALAGKECWIPYSYQGRDYRLGLGGEHLLWTPQHRIFRQAQGESWPEVFNRIIPALEERVNANASQYPDERVRAGAA